VKNSARLRIKMIFWIYFTEFCVLIETSDSWMRTNKRWSRIIKWFYERFRHVDDPIFCFKFKGVRISSCNSFWKTFMLLSCSCLFFFIDYLRSYSCHFLISINFKVKLLKLLKRNHIIKCSWRLSINFFFKRWNWSLVLNRQLKQS